MIEPSTKALAAAVADLIHDDPELDTFCSEASLQVDSKQVFVPIRTFRESVELSTVSRKVASCLSQRYLVARKEKLQPAAKALRKTLEWRKSYRPQDISFQEIKALAATGRLEVLDSRDLEGRPVLCYRLRCHKLIECTVETQTRLSRVRPGLIQNARISFVALSVLAIPAALSMQPSECKWPQTRGAPSVYAFQP